MSLKLEAHFFGELQRHVGSELEILTDPTDARFQEHSKRWSDIDRQTPAAIVLPRSEEHIQSTVRWAIQNSVPFVTKSGGHSTWSTIGSDGFIIDLSNYSEIKVDSPGPVAKLRGSILTKAVAVHLAKDGYFAAIGNGTQVGAIPYFLNGGASITTSLTSFGADQIIAARIIDVQGNLVEVTQEKEPDLLYAIRGAGQFFGLITELTIKVWPLAELGNDQGVIWSGRFVFPIDRAPEVAEAMKWIVEDGSKATAGLLMAICPPPARKPSLVVAARFIGDPDDAQAASGALHALKPLIADGGPVPIQNVSDGRARHWRPRAASRRSARWVCGASMSRGSSPPSACGSASCKTAPMPSTPPSISSGTPAPQSSPRSSRPILSMTSDSGRTTSFGIRMLPATQRSPS
ncbi:hypothetical protein FJTKL_10401 [Diaporthe vaccinii]|uniref:FAD-binding PCMH-type domain-containing protein n=1 Tax=Diaporthe vaccinii TaxID=105482 RepID=A0ABR4EKC5_9PEZI